MSTRGHRITEKEQAKLVFVSQVKVVGIDPPEQEVRFHETRKWRFDLAWPDRKVAVEVNGGVFTNGRHTRGKGYTEDREKINEAQLHGWLVLEVTPKHISKGVALQWLERALNA